MLINALGPVNMGRRPSPIVVHYFARGAKIGNVSNRYEHTCRLCGERFPKGRTEDMHKHISTKCNGLSLREKTDLVLQIAGIKATIAASGTAQNERKREIRKKLSSPFSAAQQQNFNGLNVLAEVSGRVEKTRPSYPPQMLENGTAGRQLVLDPALEDDPDPNDFLTIVAAPDPDQSNGESGDISLTGY
jgi:hypothetical protein